MDSVQIRGLAVDTIIGVFDWEQRVKQTLLIDIDLHYNISAAANNDDLRQAVDYQAVADRIRQHASSARLKLIETLAEQLAAIVLAEFSVQACGITVHKPSAIEGAEDVSVRIERG